MALVWHVSVELGRVPCEYGLLRDAQLPWIERSRDAAAADPVGPVDGARGLLGLLIEPSPAHLHGQGLGCGPSHPLHVRILAWDRRADGDRREARRKRRLRFRPVE